MTLERWMIAPGQTKVIDLELVRNLKVSMIGGKVDVIGHDETGVRVEVHSVTGKELKVSMEGDTLEIDHPQLRWDNFIDVFASFRGTAKADISIIVPRDVALKMGVVNADALISGLVTSPRLSTVSGGIVVDGVIGDLDVNGVNGEVSVRNHTGAISAHTVSGEVTASGAIRRFSLDAVSSDIFLDIEGTPELVNTNSVSGNLTVRLGADVATRYRLNTVSGTIQLDGSTIKGTLGKGYEGSDGALDGSWLELKANSVSGHISVVRRANQTTGAPDAGSSNTASGASE
jgi:Putative adhesin